MKRLFEIPELLTMDGNVFRGETGSTDGGPNSCFTGCEKGCGSGGCFPGSSIDEN